MEKVIIYSNGIIYCSVCVEKGLKEKEIEDTVNTQNPTGIKSGKWKIASEDFQNGAPNPCRCDRYKNRLHYLLVC